MPHQSSARTLGLDLHIRNASSVELKGAKLIAVQSAKKEHRIRAGAQRRTNHADQGHAGARLLVSALAAMEAYGLRDGGQAALSYQNSPAAIGGNAGGNLVPLW
jgi:hypothetical protein